MNYFPLGALPIALLTALAAVVTVLVVAGVLRFARASLGLSPTSFVLLLFASLLGSAVNLPLYRLPEQAVLAPRVVRYYGMDYVVPTVVDWPGTVVAINVGGAVIPLLLSLHLLVKHDLWLRGSIATLLVAVACYAVAEPVPGLGIVLPIFVPPIVTAVVALLVSWRDAAPLAYVSGSLGTLIGADLLNLPLLPQLGAPVASIGGAGTFDGIFVTGALALIMAGALDRLR